MVRLFAVALLLLTPAAFAQTPQATPCTRDVARHCRSQMNDGDMVVLACLKEHRAALSKACQKVLTDHGQ
jgi:hypothetical protein